MRLVTSPPSGHFSRSVLTSANRSLSQEECKRLDLERTTIIAALKIKVIRDKVRQTLGTIRHDPNDSDWTITSLADPYGHLVDARRVADRNPWEKDPTAKLATRLIPPP